MPEQDNKPESSPQPLTGLDELSEAHVDDDKLLDDIPPEEVSGDAVPVEEEPESEDAQPEQTTSTLTDSPVDDKDVVDEKVDEPDDKAVEWDPELGEDAVTIVDAEEEKLLEPSDGDEPDYIDIESEIDEVESLELLLAAEFRDTLTGFNSFTLPIGLLLIIAGAVCWYLNPILNLIGVGSGGGGGVGGGEIITNEILLISSVILILAGLHFIFYWGIHRVSNFVKTRELDRLVEERRVKKPCRHLTCIDLKDKQASLEWLEPAFNPFEDDSGDDEICLQWQCGFFDMDLEDYPVCVICERYEDRSEVENTADGAGPIQTYREG